MSRGYYEPEGLDFGPPWGLAGAELALWRCWEATGDDVSGGPCADWHQDALDAVMQQRVDHDRFQGALDDLINTAEQVRVDLKEIL